MMYDTLMGMMGLTAVHYDSACNLFSPDFDKDVTTLMTMYGNVMIRNDREQVGENKEEIDRLWNRKRMEAAEEAGHMNFNWNNFDQTFLRTQPVTYIRNEGVSQK